MARTATLQNLGRDDAGHCKVLAEKINRGDASAAKEFFNCYGARKRKEIARKHNPKALVGAFLETASFLAQKSIRRD